MTEKTKISKCSICGSPTYGKGGCIWSPYNKTHMHTDDQTKCSWCGGKKLYGPFCPYSPTGHHGLGANLFANMATESFISAYVFNKITAPIIESQAFALGLIDHDGNLLKKPVTEAERAAYTPLDSIMIRLKKMLGERVDMLNAEILLETKTMNSKEKVSFTKEQIEAEIDAKNQLGKLADHFYEIVNESKLKGLSDSILDEIITEAFVKR